MKEKHFIYQKFKEPIKLKEFLGDNKINLM